MLEEKKRRPALGAVPAIGVADTVNLDELSGGGNMGVGHNLSFPGLPATWMAGVSYVKKAGSGKRARPGCPGSEVECGVSGFDLGAPDIEGGRVERVQCGCGLRL